MEDELPTIEERKMTTTVIDVTGMTCGNCTSHVTAELIGIAGVTGVAVDLNPQGTSHVTVTSDAPLAATAVEEAVSEAGYDVVGIR